MKNRQLEEREAEDRNSVGTTRQIDRARMPNLGPERGANRLNHPILGRRVKVGMHRKTDYFFG